MREREEISRGLQQALPCALLPEVLDDLHQRYVARSRAMAVHKQAGLGARAAPEAVSPGICTEPLRWLVAHKLALQWSPQQIAGRLRREYPGDPSMRISHEAIYRTLFIQSPRVLKKELTAHLRTKRQMRLAKGAQCRTGQGQILDMVSIRERPAEAGDRAVSGHWENDLLAGANDTNTVTRVERHSRLTMLVKLARRGLGDRGCRPRA